MAFAEDLSQFFDTDDFAVSAAFTRAGVAVAAADVIFNGPSHQVAVYETAVEELAPFLLAPASAVAAVKRKDAVAADGHGSFVVERIEPDGTGLTKLYLAEA
jgi:hypothetical protein